MCENKLNLGHSLRMLFAQSILLALLAACGDESSSSAPDPIGDISSSSNDDNGSSGKDKDASSSSQKDSKKSGLNQELLLAQSAIESSDVNKDSSEEWRNSYVETLQHLNGEDYEQARASDIVAEGSFNNKKRCDCSHLIKLSGFLRNP